MYAMATAQKKGILEKLQSLDERTKQRVLIVSTIIIMAIIIYFWLAYFNTIVAGVAEQAAPAANVPAAMVATPSPASAANNGGAGGSFSFGTFGQLFENIANGIKNMLQTPGQYIVKP